MRRFTSLTCTLGIATILALGLTTAQAAGHTIDFEMVTVNYWHVVEIAWAGDEPLSGETSTFDGRCSVPSDYLARGHGEGLVFPIGPGVAESEHCGQLVWEEEDGQRVLQGRLGTDGVMTLRGDDGSVMTATFYADETGFDPLMGMFHYGMHFEIESMTGMEHLGLAFVSGSMTMHFVFDDIEALLTESVPSIGVGYGTASFTPEATD